MNAEGVFLLYTTLVTFGLMAIPTMLASLLLAPKVMAAARDYFGRLP